MCSRMRTAGVLVLALSIGVSSAAARDRGRKEPPSGLSESKKALWMGEWVACEHQSLHSLAKELGVTVPAGRTPQVEAKLIAKTAEAPLWDLDSELAIAVDGCRSGILWRYYQGPA